MVKTKDTLTVKICPVCGSRLFERIKGRQLGMVCKYLKCLDYEVVK